MGRRNRRGNRWENIERAGTSEHALNGNSEFRKAWFLAIWRGLTTEPVWKYQELPPFLSPELIKLDLVEASDSELSRVMWFWMRPPRLTLHESTALIVLALCALLSLTISSRAPLLPLSGSEHDSGRNEEWKTGCPGYAFRRQSEKQRLTRGLF